MKDDLMIVEFPEQTTVIAKEQPEYHPLPAHVVGNDQSEIICCWKANIWVRLKILFTGTIWHSVWTFNAPLQPLRLTVHKPEMK